MLAGKGLKHYLLEYGLASFLR